MIKAAAIWVGHIRTFHRVFPENIVTNCWEQLGYKQDEVINFFYTYPSEQCKRNRPNDPPSDFSFDKAMEYMKMSLEPFTLSIKDNSNDSNELYNKIVSARKDMNVGHIATNVYQYKKRTEAWNDFIEKYPTWKDLDVIFFHRPDVSFDDKLKSFEFEKNIIYVMHALGAKGGIDDRWAFGSPEIMQKYMSIGDDVKKILLDEKREWWPELNYARHLQLQNSSTKEIKYLSKNQNENHYVNIARFEQSDGKLLSKKFNTIKESYNHMKNTKRKIAVLWVGHIRTMYKCSNNLIRNVLEPNMQKYDFDHYFHLYDNLTTGNSPRPNFNDKIDIKKYFDAAKKHFCTKDERFIYKSVDVEDQKRVDSIASVSNRPGNWGGTTYQFLKKTRAWKDLFKNNTNLIKQYDAFMFVRPDATYVSKFIFPEIDLQHFSAPIILSWNDKRINGNCEDDRWFLVPKHAIEFIENLGNLTCEFRANSKNHIMPEEAFHYAIRSHNLKKVYIHEKDPITIQRFNNGDIGRYNDFINSSNNNILWKHSNDNIDTSKQVLLPQKPIDPIIQDEKPNKIINLLVSPKQGGNCKYIIICNDNLPSENWIKKHVIMHDNETIQNILIFSYYKNYELSKRLLLINKKIIISSYEDDSAVDMEWIKTFNKEMSDKKYKLSSKMSPNKGFNHGLITSLAFSMASYYMKTLDDTSDVIFMWALYNPTNYENLFKASFIENTITVSKWAGRNGITPTIVAGKIKVVKNAISPEKWIDIARKNIEVSIQTFFAEKCYIACNNIIYDNNIKWMGSNNEDLSKVPMSFWKPSGNKY